MKNLTIAWEAKTAEEYEKIKLESMGVLLDAIKRDSQFPCWIRELQVNKTYIGRLDSSTCKFELLPLAVKTATTMVSLRYYDENGQIKEYNS